MAFTWPVVDGDYAVGDPDGCVAVCVLTSAELKASLAVLPGVAIAGTLQTANLGIERLVQNVVANPRIRFLFLCGKESTLFHPGDALQSLLTKGVGDDRKIAATKGYEPFLRNLPPASVERFRRQVELAAETGETGEPALRARIGELARHRPDPFDEPPEALPAEPEFKKLRPGGKREPLQYDPNGLFVITTEPPEIVVRHYSPEMKPLHEMRGRNPSSLMLGLLRENLVSQLSHAGYLGQELQKAQLAIKAGVTYAQDRPLALEAARQSSDFSAAVEVLSVDGQQISGVLLEPDPASPYDTFRRTEEPISVNWGARIAMGDWTDVRPGALLRLRGLPESDGSVRAVSMAVLTSVAKVSAGQSS